jgi:hypothetical protein
MNALLISTICYVVTIPYVLFGWKILLINSMTYLYNIGFLSFVLLYMSTYNKKRIDLSRGSAFDSFLSPISVARKSGFWLDLFWIS